MEKATVDYDDKQVDAQKLEDVINKLGYGIIKEEAILLQCKIISLKKY